MPHTVCRVNLAYIISAYRLPEQLVRLVTRLRTENATVLVHKAHSQVLRRHLGIKMAAPSQKHYAIAPADPQTLYVGTGRGVAKTTDGVVPGG